MSTTDIYHECFRPTQRQHARSKVNHASFMYDGLYCLADIVDLPVLQTKCGVTLSEILHKFTYMYYARLAFPLNFMRLDLIISSRASVRMHR